MKKVLIMLIAGLTSASLLLCGCRGRELPADVDNAVEETHTEVDADTDRQSDEKTESSVSTDSEALSESDTVSDTEAEADTETETDTANDTEITVDADTATDLETSTESGTDTETDTESDTEAETEDTRYRVTESYMPSQVSSQLKQMYEAREASFLVMGYSGAPYAMKDIYTISDCTVKSISMPVIETGDLDENGCLKFTLYVASSSYIRLKSSAPEAYEIRIDPAEYGLAPNSTRVYKWIKVDLSEYNITLSSNQTLAFGNYTDTITPSYLGCSDTSVDKNAAQALVKSEFPQMTGFFSGVGSSSLNSSKQTLVFDFELERTYDSEEDFLTELYRELDYREMVEALKERYSGKTLSILGDSISTYNGISNDTGANSTIGSNSPYYPEQNYDLYDYTYTYWGKLMKDLDMTLCVNNSWGGSKIIGNMLQRATELDNDNGTPNNPSDDIAPDIIIVYMGINDLQGGSNMGDLYNILATNDGRSNDEKVAEWLSTLNTSSPETVEQAYALSLKAMKEKYPNAEIWCMTPIATTDGRCTTEKLGKYSRIIDVLSSYFDCGMINNLGGYITPATCHAYGADGTNLHPGPMGHAAIEKYILENFYKKIGN